MNKKKKMMLLFGGARFGPELVTNGGFETAGAGGVDIWANWAETAGDGALADETTVVRSGSHAAKLTAGSTRGTNIQTVNVAVTPGKTYRYSFWTRGDGTNPARYGIRNTVSYDWIISPTTSTGITAVTYNIVIGTFVAPAGCTTILFACYCANTDTAVSYFDDVSIKLLP